MNNHILELALETLNARKAEIEKEIVEIIAQLQQGARKPTARMHRSQRMKEHWARKRREKEVEKDFKSLEIVGKAARWEAISKSRSEAMKAAWKRRRERDAEAIREWDKELAAKASKRRPLTNIEKQAVSKRMKAYWAKKRAEKANAAKKP